MGDRSNPAVVILWFVDSWLIYCHEYGLGDRRPVAMFGVGAVAVSDMSGLGELADMKAEPSTNDRNLGYKD